MAKSLAVLEAELDALKESLRIEREDRRQLALHVWGLYGAFFALVGGVIIVQLRPDGAPSVVPPGAIVEIWRFMVAIAT